LVAGRLRCLRPIGAERERPIERHAFLPDIGKIGAFDQREHQRIMPKRAGVSSSALQAADTGQFASIALFSGIGLLISLFIVICRMNGIF
jgi:hypothetical protein